MKHTTEEDRKSWRFPTILNALYFLREKKGQGKECTVINISLNGAGLEFYTCEAISVNEKLFLAISSPDGKETVNVEGIVRWVKQGRKDFVCGIKLTETLDKAKQAMLKV